MKLKYKADMLVSEPGKFLFTQFTDVGTVNIKFPLPGFISVPAICRKVVLPAPLAPTMVTISPF